ncbi:hypothetical protein, partial [Alcanivorax sp. VBW004]|uniref:hypothetical protein n=1 Tax=Alcanivorax sp. VBW004 TaxID=1287708 RepID=UPI001E4E7784
KQKTLVAKASGVFCVQAGQKRASCHNLALSGPRPPPCNTLAKKTRHNRDVLRPCVMKLLPSPEEVFA